MYVYDLDNLRSGVTVRYAIRFDTHPNILKVMRDAKLTPQHSYKESRSRAKGLDFRGRFRKLF